LNVSHWTVQGSNPSRGEIFCTCPEQLWGPASLLYEGYKVLGVKQLGCHIDHSPPYTAKVKEGVELYLYYPCAFMVYYRVNFTFYLYYYLL
jgi:hypothetical protein